MAHTPSAPRSVWFWVNLVALLVLVPLATALFQQHLKLYFTGIVLLGGVFTTWALVRLLWGIFEKATEIDAWDYSRKLLSSAGMTRLLIVGGLVLAFLWPTTASLYFEASGGDAGAYTVEVTQGPTGRRYMDTLSLSAAEPVKGAPRFLQFAAVPLRCQIVEPVGYEPADCSLVPGRSTRLQVPKGFREKEFHLVRLVPAASFYRLLPKDTQVERSSYDLDLTVERDGAEPATVQSRWSDLRRQTLSVIPLDEAEQSAVRRLGVDAEYRRDLLDTFLAKGIESAAAEQTAAVLVSSRKEWPVAYLRAGDRLSINILRLPDPGEPSTAPQIASTLTHVVTAEKVQIVWLSLSQTG